MSWVKKSVIRAGLVSGRIITRKELRNGPHAGFGRRLGETQR
jgi:hypothetical protein